MFHGVENETIASPERAGENIRAPIRECGSVARSWGHRVGPSYGAVRGAVNVSFEDAFYDLEVFRRRGRRCGEDEPWKKRSAS